MISQQVFKGISFPFGFNSSGSTKVSETNENDLTHIGEEVRQRLLTRKGERANRPDFGSELHEVIFKAESDSTTGLAMLYTKQALEPMNDRIQVVGVEVEYDEGGTDIDGTVTVYVDIFVIKYMTGLRVSVSYDKGGM